MNTRTVPRMLVVSAVRIASIFFFQGEPPAAGPIIGAERRT